MVHVVGLLPGQCRSNAFASYLEVSVQRGPDSPASRLHLVDLVGQQTRSYLD
jgi:hypothetical protein